MRKPKSASPFRHLRGSDVRGIAQLATQATTGITRIAEGVHQSVLGSMGLPGGEMPGQTRGLTGLVYQSIRSVTQLLGTGADALLAALQPLIDRVENAADGTPQREAALAALNGVMGDRLVASNNPFATPMTLYYRSQALNWLSLPPITGATRKVMLLIHGLCMNDLQWRARDQQQVAEHGEVLGRTLGYTPVYLRYNSGLHISQNARELAAQLEQLVTHWPTPVDELTVVAHSMGGLVTRGAVHYAREESLGWPQHLKNIVFLGTPHHGAPLERAGNWLDLILGSTPYTAPFARLGQLRSAGITDLRHGHVLDEDWHGHDRFARRRDNRRILPLPEGVACYAIAATTAAKRGALADRLIGDGLVPLHSALGQHEDTRRDLGFAKLSQWIAYRTNHMELLRSPAITQQMLQWLAGQVDAR